MTEKLLKGKVALVTGAGVGIGRAVALSLAQSGAAVAVNHRRAGDGGRDVVELIRSSGGEALSVRADVRMDKDVTRMKKEISDWKGPVTLLVNNVGNFLEKPLRETRISDWESMIDSNLLTAVRVSRKFVPAMRRRRYGRIVNLLAAGAESTPGKRMTAAYYAAKSGLMVYTRSLALEEVDNGITVNAVAPGWVEASKDSFPSLPAGGPVPADAVARSILFLLSEPTVHLTGNCLTVSGAWLL